MAGEAKVTNGEDYNIFRDSPLRYLGYANEVGESFRYQFPALVVPSYAVAFGYCLADAATSGNKTYQKGTQNGSPSAKVDALVTTVDTLIWQSLASVTIPGATINMIVKASRITVARSPVALPLTVSKWIPTASGLGSIPFIIRPIDYAVDEFMGATFRKVRWPGASPGGQNGDGTTQM